MNKKKLSIVIPAYNEELVLEELASRLQTLMKVEASYDFEVILIENGSVDGTEKKIEEIIEKDSRFKMIQLSRNFGCDGGITAGLQYAKGNAIVIMNADLQDPPEMIGQFLRKWEEGFEIVYGVIEKREGVSFFRRIFSSLFYLIINRLTGGIFPKNVSDFRLIDETVCRAALQLKERNRFLRGIVMWTGFKAIGIPFVRPPRFAGETKAPFFTIFKLALDGIFSFSYLPLKITTGLGLLLSIGSFIVILIFVVLYFSYGREVPGHTSTVTLMLFLFGMLFFVLGIIGEYLARIYDEVKQRPNFIIKKTKGVS